MKSPLNESGREKRSCDRFFYFRKREKHILEDINCDLSHKIKQKYIKLIKKSLDLVVIATYN